MWRPVQHNGFISMKTRARSSFLSGLALSSLAGCAILQGEIGPPAARTAAPAQPVLVREEVAPPARAPVAPLQSAAQPVRATTPDGLPIFQVPADPPAARPVMPAPPPPVAAKAPALPSPTAAIPVSAASAAATEKNPATAAASAAARAVPPPPPAHDFPWMAGAVHVRAQEETTFGVGARMFGRLFAKVEFASGPTSPAGPSTAQDNLRNRSGGSAASASRGEDSPVTPLACTGVTCLDVARDSLLRDADRKGWKVILNRRIALQQSFMFQRDDRMVLIEVKSTGGQVLDLEYGLIPVQGSLN